MGLRPKRERAAKGATEASAWPYAKRPKATGPLREMGTKWCFIFKHRVIVPDLGRQLLTRQRGDDGGEMLVLRG